MTKPKLLIISGVTASGKTSLAVELAKRFNGELISADSRQVYKGMDIGTGKDLDIGCHQIGGIPVWLLDVVEPNEEFSVVDWLRYFETAVEEIYKKTKLPILVGGTGFYIDAILNPKENFLIKSNKLLRWVLNRCSTDRIRGAYKFLDKNSFKELNNSEKNNRHRLIRKIEIFVSRKWKVKNEKYRKKELDCLHVSLTGGKELIKKRIDERIKKRLKQGLLKEIKGLLKKYKWSDVGMNTLAYKEFEEYFKKTGKKLEECVERWRMDEYGYAKRQRVWFKKRKEIKIFDIGKKEYEEKIFKLIKNWYN